VSKRKLLLADDSVTIQKVVNLTFAEEGIEVITAGDGNSAMEKFVEFAPDLVMVDVNMPGFDGYRICEMIKQDEETKQIPVILLVGSFEPFDEAEARRVGADDYLTKPFQSIRQLVSRVSDLLNRSNGEISSYNQDNASFENQAAEASVTDFGNRLEMTNNSEFEKFDNTGMDDEMIQTNQIGSLPADESQKFVSEPNFQTSENNFASQGADENEEVSPENQLSTAEPFQQMPVSSTEDEILQFDEKVFDFADKQPFVQETEPEISEQESQKSLDDKKFPEYSAIADNKNIANDTEFNMTAQPQNESFFDFDDLNLLDIPPLDKKPLPAADQEARTEEIPENFDTKSISEKNEPAESGENKELTEMTGLSPEVIEAIAKKIMEKLSDKVIKEIAQGITPQTVESVIEEMARKKTN
jgi:DNA-binding response OmpR family regulator/polyhydroxyalkanoate synthesis regulator phasin